MRHMTLKQCLRIRENQYRSADCVYDYCPFEIEQRIADLGVKHAERMVETERNGGFDSTLFALLPSGQQLLNLIDQAFKQQTKGVSMKMTINQANFVNLFADYNRADNFSIAGRRALFDFLEEVDPNWECDIIALCCDFSEIDVADIEQETGCESLDDLQDNTTVIMVDDSTVIYQVF
jgi:hypothetical protein